jgi:anion transporter
MSKTMTTRVMGAGEMHAEKGTHSLGNYWKALVPIAVGAVLLCLPIPTGLTPNAWYYFALFVAVVIALILEPIPAAAVGVIGVTAATVSLLVTPKAADAIKWALSGFQDGTVWLIFVAFMFALGYEKTGLGRRVALNLVNWLGKRTLGLGYAVALADLVLAPFTPSNTARSGGTIFPVIKNIPPLYGSEPNSPTARKIGAYLMWTAFATTCLTSAMFLTGLAPNLLALSLVKTTAKVDITWTEWFMGMAPVGLLLFIFLPLIVYKVYPPELKSSPDVPVWAAGELKKMGRITIKEIGMAVLALLALGLWIFGGDFINATTVALLVLSLMVMTRIVEWDDVLAHKQAWNVLVWFGDDGRRFEQGRVSQVVCRGRGGSFGRVLGDDRGGSADSRVLRRALHVREPYRAHNGAPAGAAHRSDRGARDAGQADFAPVLLYPGAHGNNLSVRHRPGPDLLRQRLREPKRVLDSGADLWSDLSGGDSLDRCSFPAVLSRVA